MACAADSSKTPGSSAFGGEKQRYCLRVVYSPDGRVVGQDLVVKNSIVAFGRHEGAVDAEAGDEGRLEIADPRLSRRHLEVRAGPGPGVVGIRDLNSKNGTWLNGRRIRQATARLHDVVRAGDTFFVLCPLVRPSAARFDQFGELIGVSAAMVEIRRTVSRFTTDEQPILLAGESGVGKELIAAAIHTCSQRRGRFIPVSSSTIPHNLIEHELFGVTKEGQPSADRSSKGFMVQANKGTLFMDEIQSLSPEAQVRFLRAVAAGEVVAVGSKSATRSNVLFVSGTAVSMEAIAEAGDFDIVLLRKLSELKLSIPPLRERKEDIPVLWDHLIGSENLGRRPDAATMEALLIYPWPGNVREMKEAAGLVVLRMEETGEFSAKTLPRSIFDNFRKAREATHQPSQDDPSMTVRRKAARRADTPVLGGAGPVHHPSREELVRLLHQHEGNLKAAARQLGRSEQQLLLWLESFGINL